MLTMPHHEVFATHFPAQLTGRSLGPETWDIHAIRTALCATNHLWTVKSAYNGGNGVDIDHAAERTHACMRSEGELGLHNIGHSRGPCRQRRRLRLAAGQSPVPVQSWLGFLMPASCRPEAAASVIDSKKPQIAASYGKHSQLA